ncbi:4-hydroxy-tetrahydrodipicolinate reductase [Paludicola sp. MB14-C6]|uniref:4-hydroxy-tetrahydrodipicolinate reductase n=1 Tax=Paludihabitans sp. MB14-C6 TaxID=3070656 RepID=UPI0027DCACD4|nr:4-hydroxy-tetrahydrodipicolinate reductase [Paludicola sp. MB14-C6]WMJ23058.1 4-hydroxy-tetrahydrodipicolinate reductase [Paludicola sp. MB14-C6]
MTRILLSGANGRMGHVIENCSHNFENTKIVSGVDLNNKEYALFPIHKSITECREKADVIIDFSHPSCLNDLLTYAISNNLPLVAATTGYNEDQIALIKQASNKIPVFFTFNMSLGVNLLIDLAKKATAVLGDQFDIEIIEKHHNQKIDAPSGTAIMLANAINQTAQERYQYEFDRHSKRQKRQKNEIGIHAVRGGTIVGEHEVIFAGRDEIVTLTHQAMSKDIFAVGALKAAQFLKDQKPGLYSMSDLL